MQIITVEYGELHVTWCSTWNLLIIVKNIKWGEGVIEEETKFALLSQLLVRVSTFLNYSSPMANSSA